MKKLRFLLAAVMLVGVFALSACSGGDTEEVLVYNWGDYIDREVLTLFEEETGIKVKYDTFATNEDMYVKIKGGGSNYDVIIPSDYMIQRMIREDMLETMDMSKLENYGKIDPALLSPAYDPTDEYSVPYMWGTVGILYDKTKVTDPVDSWNILWDEKYSKQILMLDSVRDSFFVAAEKVGVDPNSHEAADLEKVKAALIEQKPLVLAYVGDDVKDMMIGGEASLAVVWSGDAVYCMNENENLAYAIPMEGSNIWVDGMSIPKDAPNYDNAMKFIDFMCRPDIAKMNNDYIGYASPLPEVQDQLSEELKSDPAANPTEEEKARCVTMEDLGDATEMYDSLWTEIKATQ